MPTTDDAVRFLIENDSLRLDENPWRSLDDSVDVFPVEWSRLFPPPRGRVSEIRGFPQGDNWDFDVSDRQIAELGNYLGVHPGNQRPDTMPDWDICAWYQPMHFFGHDWGIFIRQDCAWRTALMIARFVPAAVVRRVPPEVWLKALYRAAIYIYFLHEHFHHKIECLGFRLHVVTGRSHFLPYHAKVYSHALGTDALLEEALANADCYGRIATRPYSYWITSLVVEATRSYLQWQFPHDPPGYRKAVDYLTASKFAVGENLLQAQVKEAAFHPVQPIGEWNLAPRMTQSVFPVTSNIWTVVPKGARSRLPVKAVKPVRTCSTREMRRLFESAGYSEVDGGKGSHLKLKKPGSPTMILPGDRNELSPGVAKTALRVLGDYRLADLPQLLKRVG
jgi:predicted RNA binding protein YcfA (HicA-like mRNA interferase family)